MYRIRFHGRGGQGMKTASRILGTAFFRCGYEVQDAPRYGAERRGAPVFAYVRAGHRPILERGPIDGPDLIVVADDTLLESAAAAVVAGLGERTVLLIATDEAPAVWKERLGARGAVVRLPLARSDRETTGAVSAICAAAAARLVGVIPVEALEAAIREELSAGGAEIVDANLARVGPAWSALAEHAGSVDEGPEAAIGGEAVDWIDLPFEPADRSAPTIHAAANSVEVRTGLWRTVRPVIDSERCNRCSWICGTLCPDSAIAVDDDRTPRIDYDHCKGCGICAAVCPPHAIDLVVESDAANPQEGAA